MVPKVTVIGSINMDLITETTQIPIQGETILGNGFKMTPGGKGANQAVAAAKLGGDVTFIGRVGDDFFGNKLIEHMKRQRVSVDHLEPVTHYPTGVANVLLSDQDNRIIVVPGANKAVTPEVVETYKKEIALSDVLLLQLEIPLQSVVKAAEIAKQYNTKVILNPAPIQYLPELLLENTDLVTPNQQEFKQLISSTQRNKVKNEQCIITMGKEGAVYTENHMKKKVNGFEVPVVDTTGAGDTFNGALAVAISEAKPINEAVSIANAAAALSIQKLGAQSGMPDRDEVLDFISNHSKKIIGN